MYNFDREKVHLVVVVVGFFISPVGEQDRTHSIIPSKFPLVKPIRQTDPRRVAHVPQITSHEVWRVTWTRKM